MTNGRTGCLSALVFFSGLSIGILAGGFGTWAITYPQAYMKGYEAGKADESPKPYLSSEELRSNFGLGSPDSKNENQRSYNQN